MIETAHFWFNVVEACIWFAISIRFLLYGLKRITTLKKSFLVFSITLLFFGISDIIETQTGAKSYLRMFDFWMCGCFLPQP